MAGMFDNLTFGFNANDPVSPEGMALRQRIAMQMMGQGGRKGYPKNAGEGLTAIGDSLGDIGMANRLERQMAGLEARSAARAPLPATLPPAAASKGTDPSVRSDVFDTGAAPVQFANVPDAVDAAPPPMQTADAAPAATGPANAVQASQLATLLGTEGGDQTPSYAPTASADANAPVVEQAPSGNLSPAAAQVRNRIAAMQTPTAPGVPQPNPTLGAVPAALSASTAPMVPPPEQAGSPDEAADNRPIVLAQNTSPNYPSGTKRGTGDFPNREVYIGIKPSTAPSEPVPAPEAQPRYQTPELATRPPVFSAPPRIEAPGKDELDLMRAASDPTVLGSYQTQYKERAAELAQKRADDHKQAMDAWTSKNLVTQKEYEAERNRVRDAAKIELEQQAAEQKKQAADYAERITRHLGGRNPATIEENLYKSRASVANIPAIAQSLQRTKAIVDKMYTGPFADVETFLSQALPFGGLPFDPSRGTATQQFKTAMTDIMAAHRAAVVGPGSQSGPELALLQKSTAADAKLNKDTIREALDAAEKLMVKTAIAHQQDVHNYAGNFDADRTRSVFGSFGVPGIENVVPQRSIAKLMDNAGDKNVLNDFDETYHTPGLAMKLIQREMARRGAR